MLETNYIQIFISNLQIVNTHTHTRIRIQARTYTHIQRKSFTFYLFVFCHISNESKNINNKNETKQCLNIKHSSEMKEDSDTVLSDFKAGLAGTA